jgi:hypothetical protein
MLSPRQLSLLRKLFETRNEGTKTHLFVCEDTMHCIIASCELLWHAGTLLCCSIQNRPSFPTGVVQRLKYAVSVLSRYLFTAETVQRQTLIEKQIASVVMNFNL